MSGPFVELLIGIALWIEHPVRCRLMCAFQVPRAAGDHS